MPFLAPTTILPQTTRAEVEGVRCGRVPDDAAGGRDGSLEPPGAEGSPGGGAFYGRSASAQPPRDGRTRSEPLPHRTAVQPQPRRGIQRAARRLRDGDAPVR